VSRPAPNRTLGHSPLGELELAMVVVADAWLSLFVKGERGNISGAILVILRESTVSHVTDVGAGEDPVVSSATRQAVDGQQRVIAVRLTGTSGA